MDDISRRRLLLVSSGSLSSLVGCQNLLASDDDRTESPSRTPKETPTSTRTQSPESLLPKGLDRWNLVRTSEYGWRPIGARDGIRGHYTDENGVQYQVLIMDVNEIYDIRAKTVGLHCNVGWEVALSVDSYIFAASTGTVQKTYTPERPPTMTQTPVPGTTEQCKLLLSHSPALTLDQINEQAVTDESC